MLRLKIKLKLQQFGWYTQRGKETKSWSKLVLVSRSNKNMLSCLRQKR